MKTHTAAIVQARTGSTRLPGKIMMSIGEVPLLGRVVMRVGASSVDEVIIATTGEDEDNPVADYAGELGLRCYRGSEHDVLDRIYRAAKEFGVDHIVRVTSDCPLIDPRLIDATIRLYREGGYDYASNTSRYPDGLDAEVFSFGALERAWKEADVPSDREHVSAYLRNSGKFRVGTLAGDIDLSRYKWSVDTADDLEFVRQVFERLGNGIFHMEDVLQVLDRHPEVAAFNRNSIRDAGYYRSLVADPPTPIRELPLSRSYALKEKASRFIPSCTQTFSKGPTRFVQGVAPVYLERGHGSHVWDVDGNEYIEYSMGLGPVILGHAYPAVVEAVHRQVEGGVAFSLPHPLEIETAELLVELIPCAEMVRFGKNGSDATAGAVRVARAYTGRDMIACCGYHGWQDWYIGTTTRSSGVPKAIQELTAAFAYNDISSLETLFQRFPGRIAAVIMEPIGVIEPEAGFLGSVRDLCGREGALLIFDEVITGFRLAIGGAQELFGVVPDLACFGKAMGNGFPISAVVGRREIMERFDEIFFSFTFGGEAASLAASKATLGEMREKDVIAHLWSQGRKVKDGYNTLCSEYAVETYTRCIGLPPRSVVTFSGGGGGTALEMESFFQQECLRRGVLFTGGHNLSYSHRDGDIDHTLRVYRTVLELLAQAIKEGQVRERLEGAAIQPVFRQP